MAFLAGVPASRLGEEVGWTTVYYYSAHEEDRRDIWRHQWRQRLKIDKALHLSASFSSPSARNSHLFLLKARETNLNSMMSFSLLRFRSFTFDSCISL